jgi:DNA topoisomerase-1
VMSENEAGKATGWSAWYNDGKWETQAASKPAAKTKAKAKKK